MNNQSPLESLTPREGVISCGNPESLIKVNSSKPSFIHVELSEDFIKNFIFSPFSLILIKSRSLKLFSISISMDDDSLGLTVSPTSNIWYLSIRLLSVALILPIIWFPEFQSGCSWRSS